MMANPWLTIPAADYEGHMASPHVNQLAFLARIFKESVENNNCETIALLGCATGNGLAHINNKLTRRVTAVDINPQFLALLKKHYGYTVAGLELVQEDLEVCELERQTYSLIFAGLVFEYLKPQVLLPKIANWLRADGVLVTILQLPYAGSSITETPYTSIKSLASIQRLVPLQEFKSTAGDAGLHETESKTVTLNTGKSFYIGTYERG